MASEHDLARRKIHFCNEWTDRKMVGDLPLDRFAFWKSVLIRTALIAGLLYTLMYLVVI